MHRAMSRCLLVSVINVADAATSPLPAPRFELSAPSPSMILARVDATENLEWQREPAIIKRNQDSIQDGSHFQRVERHDARPETLYRYRVRRQSSDWSRWQSLRTPDAPTHVPGAPVLNRAEFWGRFGITFEWHAADHLADGFLLIQCDDSGACYVAAVLHPDERSFDYHTVKAGTYRLAAFNSNGYSEFTAPTAVLGIDEPIARAEPEALKPEDSRVAQGLGEPDANDPRLCTTPTALQKEGSILVAVREDGDLWYDPRDCGTGGCIWTRFEREGSCYFHEGGSFFAHSPPFFGRSPMPGIQITNNSGSAYDGETIIYEGDEAVDQFRWRVFDGPYPGQKPPFDDFGNRQFVRSVEFNLE